MLADADGIEVCRALKGTRVTAHVPVLMVTAMTGDAVERSSIAAGADGYWSSRSASTNSYRKCGCICDGSARVERETA